MTLTLWIFLGLAGGFGAICRWNLDLTVKKRANRYPELGIALVNIVACLMIGFAAGYFLPTDGHYQILATGFLGGFSTFSTHIVDIVKLMETGRHRDAAILLMGTLLASILAAFTGLYLGKWLA